MTTDAKRRPNRSRGRVPPHPRQEAHASTHRRGHRRVRPVSAQRRATVSVISITGSSTGRGNRTASALTAAGHAVHAGMRDPEGRNAQRASYVHEESPKGEDGDLRVVDLDVRSRHSADAAVEAVIDEAGRPSPRTGEPVAYIFGGTNACGRWGALPAARRG